MGDSVGHHIRMRLLGWYLLRRRHAAHGQPRVYEGNSGEQEPRLGHHGLRDGRQGSVLEGSSHTYHHDWYAHRSAVVDLRFLQERHGLRYLVSELRLIPLTSLRPRLVHGLTLRDIRPYAHCRCCFVQRYVVFLRMFHGRGTGLELTFLKY